MPLHVAYANCHNATLFAIANNLAQLTLNMPIDVHNTNANLVNFTESAYEATGAKGSSRNCEQRLGIAHALLERARNALAPPGCKKFPRLEFHTVYGAHDTWHMANGAWRMARGA